MRESKSRALPLGDTPSLFERNGIKKIWGGRQVSNLLPPEPQSGALPIELRPPFVGAPGEIRTPDTRLRRPLLYPTELQARIVLCRARIP